MCVYYLKLGGELLPIHLCAGEQGRAAKAAGTRSNALLSKSHAANSIRYFPWIQNDLPQQFSLLQEKEREGEGGEKKKKKRHYFSELHATFIILPEVPHRDCVEGRKMKTAVEVLGYTAVQCCLWPLPTSAVCSNPGRECPYLLLLAKARLLPLGIIKTVVCLSAKLLRQLQKVTKSAAWVLGLSLSAAHVTAGPDCSLYPHSPAPSFSLLSFFNSSKCVSKQSSPLFPLSSPPPGSTVLSYYFPFSP